MVDIVRALEAEVNGAIAQTRGAAALLRGKRVKRTRSMG